MEEANGSPRVGIQFENLDFLLLIKHFSLGWNSCAQVLKAYGPIRSQLIHPFSGKKTSPILSPTSVQNLWSRWSQIRSHDRGFVVEGRYMVWKQSKNIITISPAWLLLPLNVVWHHCSEGQQSVTTVYEQYPDHYREFATNK